MKIKSIILTCVLLFVTLLAYGQTIFSQDVIAQKLDKEIVKGILQAYQYEYSVKDANNSIMIDYQYNFDNFYLPYSYSVLLFNKEDKLFGDLYFYENDFFNIDGKNLSLENAFYYTLATILGEHIDNQVTSLGYNAYVINKGNYVLGIFPAIQNNCVKKFIIFEMETESFLQSLESGNFLNL